MEIISKSSRDATKRSGHAIGIRNDTIIISLQSRQMEKETYEQQATETAKQRPNRPTKKNVAPGLYL